MPTKIRKNSWAKFCREFSQANQFRHATMRIENDSTDHIETVAPSIFLGLVASRQKKRVTKVSLYGGSSSFDRVVEPMASVIQPTSISVTKDETGADDCLKIVDGDGMTVSLSLEGKQSSQFCHTLKKEIAHSVHERRGRNHGGGIDDWLEAERMITKVEHELV